MATTKSFFSKPSLRFLSGERTNMMNPEPMFEFDEQEWNSNQTPSSEHKKSVVKNSRSFKKGINWVESSESHVGVTASSLPVNIPDWSKILKQEYTEREKGQNFYEDEVEEGERVPPHEYLARQFGSSFSVHEGRGRTLKGRDLSRVRNAIWEKTGFED